MSYLDLDIPKEIKRLEIIVRKIVSSKLIGSYRSIFRGKGLEFESYREYTPEEDSSLIDWKASLRSNKLLVKEFVEERNLDVIFLLDTSNKMLFGSTDKIKSRYAAEMIAALSYAILKANDNVSLILFNSKNRKVVPPGSNQKQFYNIAFNLLDKSSYGGSFDMREALKYALFHAKKGSLLIIVSDFINPGNNWQPILGIVTKKLDVIGLMIRDPRDNDLLPGYKIAIQDPDSGRRAIIDTNAIRDKFIMQARQQELQVKNEFIKASADFAVIQTDKQFILPLTEMFRRRQKRWR